MKKFLHLGVLLLNVSAATAQTIDITADATATRRQIDPRIYGVAFATTSQLSDLNATLNRSGATP